MMYSTVAIPCHKKISAARKELLWEPPITLPIISGIAMSDITIKVTSQGICFRWLANTRVVSS
jgi:hypothetical protein